MKAVEILLVVAGLLIAATGIMDLVQAETLPGIRSLLLGAGLLALAVSQRQRTEQGKATTHPATFIAIVCFLVSITLTVINLLD